MAGIDLGERIEEAERRIRPHVLETPYRHLPALAIGGWDVFAKEEQHQHTGSFKARGAFSRLLALGPAERRAGVVAASSGNHGAATAHAASVLGVTARIFVPVTASPAKIDRIRGAGAEVVLFGTDGLDTELEARRVAERDGMPYVSPYNDLDVVAGQGSVAVEMLRQGPVVDRVYVAVGGGGLIGGMAAWIHRLSPAIRVIGVLPANSPVMAASIRAGRIVEMASAPTLSDGTAGGIEAGSVTFDICRQFVHGWATVSEGEIAAAMRWWAAHEPGMIEGAAGVALAALWRDARQLPAQRAAVVICGGNITPERWRSTTTG